MEKQIGQIAEFVGQFREQGKLPSLTVVNPNGGFESATATSLQSGKQVGSDTQPSNSRSNEVEELIIEEDEQSTPTVRVETPLPQAPKAHKPSNSTNKGKEVPILINSNVVPPNVPFPRRFMQSKKEEAEKDILETFRKVQVNIPLLDAIKQVPRYAKFLKELCTTRKRISSKEVVKVSENVSAVLQRKLPTKCKDPGNFTIPCVIGELKNDGVIIQLADRSNAYPKGVLEDVLVQVNHLIFPADFYVLEMDESDHSPSLPILLGRPFMKMARTKIDVFNGTLTMEFDGEDYFDNLNDDALELVIARGMDKQNVEATTMGTHGMHMNSCAVPPSDKVIEMVAAFKSLPPQTGKFLDPILSSVSANKMLPSVVQPPTLELKPLLSHLKYVYLGEDETLPVIISCSLTAQEEGKLVRVLKEYKTAIGWTLADIKGISPTTCMHRILLEEGSKTSREAQRRLNPPMIEVVKKEVIKLLDCGVIYPISDSRWVSPVQCVPKKFGVTVVANAENEFVPTRIQTGWRVCIDYRKLNATTRKYHFPLPFINQMLERLAGIVLGHIISENGIEVDKSKIDLVRHLPSPTSVREVRSFLGHAGFYRRFIKYFSKVAQPLCRLLQKDVTFEFNEACTASFNQLKELLTMAPIIVPLDWSLPFELMCDASNYALGAVLGQRKDKRTHVIYYASQTLNDAQLNYSMTEKELLAVVFALDKFHI
ncbi:hypothetical protein ACFX1Q_000269 [Malus domestica]